MDGRDGRACRPAWRQGGRAWWCGARLGVLAWSTLVATAQAGEPLTLAQAYQATLARLPELQAAPQRREAAAAQGRAAQAWSPEPAAFETSLQSGSLGTRELAAGVAMPLWLPGQRAGTRALAQAEQDDLNARLAAARLHAAGGLREAWWALHAAREDEALAQARHAHAGALAADVARRVQAGELARIDQHQAEAALAAAQAERAGAQAALQRAVASLRGVAGRVDPASAQPTPEPLPELPEASARVAHPALLALQARVALARRAAELARLQNRAAPELTLAATRERGAAGESYGQTLSIGLRIPFGQDDRQQARQAAAGADETEALGQLAAEGERIADQIELAQSGVVLAREAAAAAARRASLAQEAQGFQDKAFRLGQSDLPARLRTAFEAFEARRHAARASVALAQAISQWRQALGLLPE